MPRVITQLITVVLLTLSATWHTAQAQLAQRLQAASLENIRTVKQAGVTTVCFENTAYRSSVDGVAQAIAACLQQPDGDAIQLVVLQHQVPRLRLFLPAELLAAYERGEADLAQVYRSMEISTDTDAAMQVLKSDSAPTQASSAWKLDVVVQPDLFLENNTLDELYTYAVNLNPALQMDLWRGAKLTAQVILPVATNLTGEMIRVRPGIIALQQQVRFHRNWFGELAVGSFTHNRYGAQATLRYRTTDGRIELGGRVGTTGFQAVTKDEGWYIAREQRLNASLFASYYEPHFNTEVSLQAHRYVYGDCGVRGDCIRHFGEHTVGVYAMLVKGDVNGGFQFTIPLPGKKWRRRGAVRIKPIDYFHWSYGMVAHGEYLHEQRGRVYSTSITDNPSSGYLQPDYVRHFLLQSLKKSKK